MEWLVRRLYALKGRGWFRSTLRYPLPDSWQGWVATLLFLVAIAATYPLDGSDAAWPVRTGILAVFAAVIFWTMDRDDLG